MKTVKIFLVLVFMTMIGCSDFVNNSENPVASSGEGYKLSKLAVPANLRAVVTDGNTVTITWDTVSGATDYQAVFTGGIGTYTSCTSPLVIRGLSNGSYSVKVKANASGDFTNTVPFSISTTPPPPPPPVNKTKLSTPVITSVVNYTKPSATANPSPSSIWPPNNKSVSVIFSGIVNEGNGTVTYSWDAVANAGSYIVNGNPQTGTSFTMSALGENTITVVAVPSNTDLYTNSDAATKTVTINPGSAKYQLIDEYGELNYSGSLSDGMYSVSLSLIASRKGNDSDGRNYTFAITVTNGGGYSVNVSAISNVPHDQRK